MNKEKDIFEHLKASKVELPDQSYFDQLAQQVIADEKAPVKVVPMYRKPLLWLSAAAAVLLIGFFALNTWSTSADSQDPLLALEEVPAEMLLAYVDEHIEDFEAESIAEILPESALEVTAVAEIELVEQDTPSNTTPDLELLDEELDEEDIINYLEEEGMDFFELEDEELDELFI